MPGSDSLWGDWPLALWPRVACGAEYGALASARSQEGLSSSAMDCPCIPRPLRRRVLDGCASQGFADSVAFARSFEARLPLGPVVAGKYDDAEDFA